MMNLASKVISSLDGRTIVTAESCTGGGIGAALTAVAGASAVYKGGIISYCNELKEMLLDVSSEMLKIHGAVSAPVAEAMAAGARKRMHADIAISVTGLAGPSADTFGNPVGTVFLGYADETRCSSQKHLFSGSREEIRSQAVEAALKLVLECAV